MSGAKSYHGPFASHLQAFIEEKRSLGCLYKEEERLSFAFDLLSLGFDCTEGLIPELANAFIAYQPNWQATTQKRRISFLQNFGDYLLRHDTAAFRPGYAAMRKMQAEFKPYVFSQDEISRLFFPGRQHPSQLPQFTYFLSSAFQGTVWNWGTDF